MDSAPFRPSTSGAHIKTMEIGSDMHDSATSAVATAPRDSPPCCSGRI